MKRFWAHDISIVLVNENMNNPMHTQRERQRDIGYVYRAKPLILYHRFLFLVFVCGKLIGIDSKINFDRFERSVFTEYFQNPKVLSFSRMFEATPSHWVQCTV